MAGTLIQSRAHSCIVPGCCTKGRHFRLPDEDNVFQEYLKRINDPKLFNLSAQFVQENFFICAKHFALCCFIEELLPSKTSLKPKALPTLFLPSYKKPSTSKTCFLNDDVIIAQDTEDPKNTQADPLETSDDDVIFLDDPLPSLSLPIVQSHSETDESPPKKPKYNTEEILKLATKMTFTQFGFTEQDMCTINTTGITNAITNISTNENADENVEPPPKKPKIIVQSQEIFTEKPATTNQTESPILKSTLKNITTNTNKNTTDPDKPTKKTDTSVIKTPIISRIQDENIPNIFPKSISTRLIPGTGSNKSPDEFQLNDLVSGKTMTLQELHVEMNPNRKKVLVKCEEREHIMTTTSMRKMCRICFKTDQLSCIYTTTYKGVNMGDILTKLLGRRVSLSRVPRNICIKCTKSLGQFYKFMQRCQTSENLIRMCHKILFKNDAEKYAKETARILSQYSQSRTGKLSEINNIDKAESNYKIAKPDFTNYHKIPMEFKPAVNVIPSTEDVKIHNSYDPNGLKFRSDFEPGVHPMDHEYSRIIIGPPKRQTVIEHAPDMTIDIDETDINKIIADVEKSKPSAAINEQFNEVIETIHPFAEDIMSSKPSKPAISTVSKKSLIFSVKNTIRKPHAAQTSTLSSTTVNNTNIPGAKSVQTIDNNIVSSAISLKLSDNTICSEKSVKSGENNSVSIEKSKRSTISSAKSIKPRDNNANSSAKPDKSSGSTISSKKSVKPSDYAISSAKSDKPNDNTISSKVKPSEIVISSAKSDKPSGSTISSDKSLKPSVNKSIERPRLLKPKTFYVKVPVASNLIVGTTFIVSQDNQIVTLCQENEVDTTNVTAIDNPVARTTAPITKTVSSTPVTITAPAIRTALPVAKTVTPVSKTATHVAKTATPVARTATPVAKTATPVTKTATPVSETATPVAKTVTPVILTGSTLGLDMPDVSQEIEHVPTLVYNCQECMTEFSEEKAFREHYSYVHRSAACDICDKSFIGEMHLIVHFVESHGITRTLKCKKCQRIFAMKVNYTAHLTKC